MLLPLAACELTSAIDASCWMTSLYDTWPLLLRSAGSDACDHQSIAASSRARSHSASAAYSSSNIRKSSCAAAPKPRLSATRWNSLMSTEPEPSASYALKRAPAAKRSAVHTRMRTQDRRGCRRAW
jgi:hypothetical protein